jgi:hypothetical protein
MDHAERRYQYSVVRDVGGRRLRCERLAVRDFDATEPDALVASTEFLTELHRT